MSNTISPALSQNRTAEQDEDMTARREPMTDPAEDAEDPEETAGLSRAGFLKIAVGGMCAVYGGAVGYPLYRFLNSPVEKSQAASAVHEVTLKDADKLPRGSALMFKFGVSPAVLIHHDDDSWTAFSAVCTHLACTVQFDPNRKAITCACHGGVYDAKTGKNIAGPPPKPLPTFVAKVSPGSVVVSRA
ncbi:MAG: Rieske (2Fe-2S) protein [Capsulimonadales bacterium]|nr:Rieske (2Fe-2S) protein [Capsulimonadales bacterium]